MENPTASPPWGPNTPTQLDLQYSDNAPILNGIHELHWLQLQSNITINYEIERVKVWGFLNHILKKKSDFLLKQFIN